MLVRLNSKANFKNMEKMPASDVAIQHATVFNR